MVAKVAKCEKLKVGKVLCTHFMQFEKVEWDLGGNSVEIRGPNGSGKSTLINAVLMALGELTGKDIPEPIMHGKEGAACTVDLIDAQTRKVCFTVKREWSRDGKPSIEVFAPDGSRFSKPQAFIDGLKDSLCARPFTWLLRRPQDQVDDVLQLFQIHPPVKDVADITGRDEPAEENETAAQYLDRLSADKTGSYYVSRTMAKQKLQEKKAALADGRRKLDELPEAPESADLNKLLADRKALESKREQSRALRHHANEVSHRRDGINDRIAEYTRDKDAAAARCKSIEQKIAELHADLKREAEVVKDRAARLDRGKEFLEQANRDLAAAEEAAAKLPDPTPAIEELDRRIQGCQQHAALIAKRRVAEEAIVALEQEEQAAEEAHSRADLILLKLRELRRHMLNGIDLGVSGLEIGDGELRHNGVPFKQASTAQRMIAACAIVARRNPRLRFLGMDDAEHFDDESVAIVRQQAAKHDWQLALSFVQTGGGLSVRFCE